MNTLNHLAIILDGNGRWAKSKGLPRKAGHVAGAKNVETICRAVHKRGIKYLTVYAFSTENWSRPEDEVSAIMKLFDSYLDTCIKDCEKNNMVIRLIGDRTGIGKLLPKVELLEDKSKNNTGLNLTIAINYGSRNEICHAAAKIAEDYKTCKISEINESIFSDYLYTKDIPDPDLILRTSGEQKLSNFLLWQAAYSEFLFVEKPWPDFDEKELDKAIEAYNNRDRRYGKIKEDN
ncbi:MAG: isoprenyl transferase [Lachnospiraceae bacterium]|nr:isoprenyl transferase [Lachnospiraceae bacterium]